MNFYRQIRCFLPVLFILLASAGSCKKETSTNEPPDKQDSTTVMKLQVPEGNKIYHAAFPDFGGTEDVVSTSRIQEFEGLAGKEIAWAYFSNNWLPETGGIIFPREAVQAIHDAGRVPFIRMMPRSNFDEGGPDPVYTMQKIISGDFDNDLKRWAMEAKHTEFPLLVEFGTEVNGNWFPWNGQYNGGDSKTGYGAASLYDGMERFRDAYRHIIKICRNEGVKNITWFYHCDVYSGPEAEWNTKAGYYPGDSYIDWIGISVYGPQEPGESWYEFEDLLGDEWDKILTISPKGKPIAILEWGTIDNDEGQKPQWIINAMNSVKPGGKFYPHIKAVSYWNENFDDTRLRIDSSPESLSAYQKAVNDTIFITKPVFNSF